MMGVKDKCQQSYLICDDSNLLQNEGELVIDTEATVCSQPSTVLLTPPATSRAL